MRATVRAGAEFYNMVQGWYKGAMFFACSRAITRHSAEKTSLRSSVARSMQHATRTMQHTARNMQDTARNMQHETRSMQDATATTADKETTQQSTRHTLKRLCT